MVDVGKTDTVAVLTRAPSAGGKTRLFAALGRPPDQDLRAALLLDTLEGVLKLDARIVVAVTPAAACDEVAHLLAPLQHHGTRIEVMAQPEGDLGKRMRGTMARLFEDGARAVAMVGSDLPSLTDVPVRAAFAWLRRDPGALVLGPALDGGYYLIAATHVPRVFDGIAWGRSDVLDATRAAAQRAGLRACLVEEVRDVDTPDDLRHAPRSSRTAAWLRRNGITPAAG
jgi:rSAM/selenodomain-associated transferase 1